jgi:hypothetical protein
MVRLQIEIEIGVPNGGDAAERLLQFIEVPRAEVSRLLNARPNDRDNRVYGRSHLVRLVNHASSTVHKYSTGCVLSVRSTSTAPPL